MIIVKLAGGLGNQMFQYAAGKALATRRKTTIKMDNAFLDKDPAGQYTRRNPELGVFKGCPEVAAESEIARFKYRKSRVMRKLQRVFPFFFKFLYVAQSGHRYHPLFKFFPSETYLDGFWQSERYFLQYREVLLRDFDLVQELPVNLQQLCASINSSECIGLHVRRGDYVSLASASAYHGSCTPVYYRRAVDMLRGRRQAIKKIFVFSDDIEWCRLNLDLGLPVEFIESNRAHEDMYLLSRCTYNIIANSSFSWWAAWLNPNPNKLVVMPAYWFVNIKSRDIDIVPRGWITSE